MTRTPCWVWLGLHRAAATRLLLAAACACCCCCVHGAVAATTAPPSPPPPPEDVQLWPLPQQHNFTANVGIAAAPPTGAAGSFFVAASPAAAQSSLLSRAFGRYAAICFGSASRGTRAPQPGRAGLRLGSLQVWVGSANESLGLKTVSPPPHTHTAPHRLAIAAGACARC